jgi:predicted nucleotidyltransferase
MNNNTYNFLIWKYNTEKEYPIVCYSDNSIGYYCIILHKGKYICDVDIDEVIYIGEYSTLDEAKNKCQKDYEKRIKNVEQENK